MTDTVPKIDSRTASDVAKQVTALLRVYAPAYKGRGLDPTTGEPIPDAPGEALISIFGRMAELTIERLNRVPEKNFLAFLDLLGASRLPPQPARVPLTFFLAAGSTVAGVVPPATQTAAPPGPGEKEPTIFETERELVVTPATLTAVFSRDPEADAYADHRGIASDSSPHGAAVFRGDRPLEHILYVGLKELLGFEGITAFTLSFNVILGATEPRQTRWERWDGEDWKPVSLGPGAEGTDGLRQSGDVAFGVTLQQVPLSTAYGSESRWLRCRLVTPINLSAGPRLNMVRSSQIPRVNAVSAKVSVSRTDRPIDSAFTNQSPIDASKDFFPFGEIPRFGDTFWLRADEPFSKAGATVTLTVTLTKAPSNPSDDLKLAWELWDGREWKQLSTPGFSDGTLAFTHTGQVTLQCPAQVAATTVGGVEGFWLRVRIVAGDYGQDSHYEEVAVGPGAEKKLQFVLGDVHPPVIKSIKADYTLAGKTGAPDAVLTYNDFSFTPVTSAFVPFAAMGDGRPTAYLGFTLPSGLTAFPNRPVSVFARAAEVLYGEPTLPLSPLRSRRLGPPGSVVTHRFEITNPALVTAGASLVVLGTSWTPAPTVLPTLELPPGARAPVELIVTVPPAAPLGTGDVGLLAVELSTEPGRRHAAAFATEAAMEPLADDPVRLVWEYWNGTEWSPLVVRDDSDRFGRSGIVEFLAPPDLARRDDFGVGARYWVRVRWDGGDYLVEPRLRRLLLNTSMATQTVTVRNESLGSSDGSKGQRFRTTRTPVLPGQHLEVREPELPTAAERTALEKEEGKDAITTTPDAAGRPRETWVRWHEVPDFYGSGPRDRHYMVDRFTGEIRLGDGLNGLIPPVGAGRRLAHYRTGGGNAGNRPSGAIVQLKTTVPYVDAVFNHEPATGGADAEPVESLLARAPRNVRHGDRSVTLEDYEDLALLATPEVARAKCVPLANLAEDPLVVDPAAPGEVSVIIVPRSTEVKPLPSLELIGRVQDFLDTVRVPTARLTVVGPLYVRVDVEAEVAVASLEGATGVLEEVQRRVAAFLHPLTGGLDGKGWDFGRQPHLSDVYALIEAAAGVDHLRLLKVQREDLPEVVATGRFLVYAGKQRISVVLEEA